jgi:hypothetical protein
VTDIDKHSSLLLYEIIVKHLGKMSNNVFVMMKFLLCLRYLLY